MKLQLTALLIVLIFLLSGCEDPTSGPTTYSIGDTGPCDGMVFYIDTDNEFDWTYLEIAPANWAPVDERKQAWGGDGIFCDNTSKEFGTGKANSANLEDYSFANELTDIHDAAIECLGYNYNMYQWWLPSLYEIREVYRNLSKDQLIELGFAVSDGTQPAFWTSSEYDAEAAWCVWYNEETTFWGHTMAKYLSRNVRPIRAF